MFSFDFNMLLLCGQKILNNYLVTSPKCVKKKSVTLCNRGKYISIDLLHIFRFILTFSKPSFATSISLSLSLRLYLAPRISSSSSSSSSRLLLPPIQSNFDSIPLRREEISIPEQNIVIRIHSPNYRSLSIAFSPSIRFDSIRFG